MHINMNEKLRNLMDKANKFEKMSLEIKKCKKCNLYKTRTKPVIGSGSFNSEIFFIGEAPGKNEDILGKPFVGRAGKILDDLLKSINLTKEDIYIANILKCRPPNNRNPQKNEIKKCTNFLDKQIRIINPSIIAPLGNFAASYIFEKFNLKYEKIGLIHGKKFQTNTSFGKIIVIPLFHPAVATYNPNKMSDLLNDFKILKKIIK